MEANYLNLPLISEDAWLEPYVEEIYDRLHRFQNLLAKLEQFHGSLYNFADAHLYFGIHYSAADKGWYYREWAPAAHSLYLMGDFNGWDRHAHPLTRRENGIWELFLDEKTYKDRFVHGSLIKVVVNSAIGSVDRIPAYIRRVIQDEKTKDFSGQLWFAQPYTWTAKAPEKAHELFIYECHTGMAQEREGLGTYREFADIVLPRIQKAGYNAIQMMAVQEHPYYGSFGYHVSNFFAASSRFGTPEDLKYLIDKAHDMGLVVIMDLVHSHAVKNLLEGLNMFDGTDHQYFHGGPKGDHSGWDSKVFNYGKWEVMRFLLSNVRYWLEEFRFDGFRFDGVTSMLYEHHGHTDFDHFDKYFRHGIDKDAITYLQLANHLIHSMDPHYISIAEDVSGMPGLCRKTADGGIGFDYRLAMGLPDFWIKMMKHYRDEDWNVWEIWSVLQNRRQHEKNIGYVESHDQAMVGDKTIAFWLMDKEMYTHMSVFTPSMVVDRGLALHKIIRLLTMLLGGEGYLNFMGNEFGHPEWIDFPREGNGWSYKYARRQWSLADDQLLKYRFLGEFDRAAVHLIRAHRIVSGPKGDYLHMDDKKQVLIGKRGSLIIAANFHPTESYSDYEFRMPVAGRYRIVLDTDAEAFGGHARVDASQEYRTSQEGIMRLYLPNRTALLLELVEKQYGK